MLAIIVDNDVYRSVKKGSNVVASSIHIMAGRSYAENEQVYTEHVSFF